MMAPLDALKFFGPPAAALASSIAVARCFRRDPRPMGACTGALEELLFATATLVATLGGLLVTILLAVSEADRVAQGTWLQWMMSVAVYGTPIFAPAAGIGAWSIGNRRRPSRYKLLELAAAVVASWTSVVVASFAWQLDAITKVLPGFLPMYVGFVCVAGWFGYRAMKLLAMRVSFSSPAGPR
jgi:hypothetical protein